jgi:hypothetical protein
MSSVTLEQVQARQTEIAAMIQRLEAQAKVRQIEIDACTIVLQAGERYAGAKLDEHGNHLHHVIVLAARQDEKQAWNDALTWGKKVGGELAAPEEYALIKANCPDLLTESWYWTNKEYEENASCAWDFGSNGFTYFGHKSAAGGALSVRRV